MANFVLKFSPFRCHGNQGRSGVNFNDTGKLLDLELYDIDNPLILIMFTQNYLNLLAYFTNFATKLALLYCECYILHLSTLNCYMELKYMVVLLEAILISG